MREQTPLEAELEQTVYGSRLIVMLECDGHFHQVALNNGQFKKVSDAIARAIIPDVQNPERENVAIRMTTNRVDAEHFLGMADFYSEQELEKMDNFTEADFHDEPTN